MEYVKQPQQIEAQSFDIISAIIAREYPDHHFANDIEEKIVKRVIHTTADFDWLKILTFSDGAIATLLTMLQEGAVIYTDTTMVLAGINKQALSQLGCDVRCYIADTNVAAIAKEKQITRSMAAVDRALHQGGDSKIFVFGNAPTALFRLLEHQDSLKESVAVIGVPVGFVGAAESKQALSESPLPHIASLGRKGGSNIAAAIVNTLLYHLRDVQS